MSEKPIRALLIDDEEDLVEHLKRRLTQRGMHVKGVHRGADAVEAVNVEVFDVAVLDLRMPGLDGIETLRELKTIQPTLEVIVLTGYGSIDSAFETGRLAAHRFLGKPYEFDDLLRAIQRAAKERRVAMREAYQKELDALISNCFSPHEILKESERLRLKYEQ